MAKKLLQWVICHIIRKSGEDKFLLSKSLTLLKEKKGKFYSTKNALIRIRNMLKV